MSTYFIFRNHAIIRGNIRTMHKIIARIIDKFKLVYRYM